MLEENNIEIVCVANDLGVFNRVIAENPYMNRFSVTMYDNSVENVGISKRYNTFIEERINKSNDDFWAVFCHQDFGFNEDIRAKVEKLDKNCIYGPIGIKVFRSTKKWFKGLFSNKFGYYPSLKFEIKGLFSKDYKFLTVEKHESQPGLFKRKLLGQISQGQGDSDFEKLGKLIKSPKSVESLDCCCLIVHSSLIRKHNLKFDENLSWHMYVEDFCMGAKKNYGIKTKAVQFDCFHLGKGNLNEDFYSAAKYVKDKYNLKRLKTTCLDD